MSQKFVRKLTRASSNSYTVNVPKELVKAFGWKEKQKLEIVFGGRKHEFMVRDWPASRRRATASRGGKPRGKRK